MALNRRGEPIVSHGIHRTIGSANGDTIAPANGGVKGQPGVLDFEFSPRPVDDAGIAAAKLKVDYTHSDDTARQAEARRKLWERRVDDYPP